MGLIAGATGMGKRKPSKTLKIIRKWCLALMMDIL